MFDLSKSTTAVLLAHLDMPKMSLYDHHLSLSLSVLLLASVSVDSLPIDFQNGCHLYYGIVSIWR